VLTSGLDGLQGEWVKIVEGDVRQAFVVEHVFAYSAETMMQGADRFARQNTLFTQLQHGQSKAE
jgi:hypothetical protein